MSHFIKSSAEQEHGRLVNLDLVTHITMADDKIRFHFTDGKFLNWFYPDPKVLDSDYRLIEQRAATLHNWTQTM